MIESQVLHFFGGKGGVGKTTLSTAFAMNLSAQYPNERQLLIATAPDKAIGDLLRRKLSSKPTKIHAGKGSGGLFVAELDASSVVGTLVNRCKEAIAQLTARGAYLDDEDLRTILAQAALGLHDFGALTFISDLIESKTYERVIVDTGATHYTLRFFDAPVGIRKLVAAVKAAEKTSTKTKKGSLSSTTLFDEIDSRAARLVEFVRDPAKTAFHLVVLPEPIPESESRAFFVNLRERGIPVAEFLVNQVEDGKGCPACQGRRGLQAPHIRKLQQVDRNVPIHLLGKREIAPRGLEGVQAFAAEWATGRDTKSLEFSVAEGPPALVRAPSMPPVAAPHLPPTRFIFFVGPGGVGKSSCAAAAAVTLTEKEGPVLLLSGDPAHSLSDLFQGRLTDTETQVKGTKGLYARELDIPNWFNGFRRRIRERTDLAFGAMKPSESPADRELLRSLLDCAPQGIEDLAPLFVLTEALTQERFKRIVVDLPPATETIRILEVADIARPWLTNILAILTKPRAKAVESLAQEIAAMLKLLGRFETALLSVNECRFIVVTRGEELAVPKTERLVDYLKSKKIPVERVLVNRVLPKTACPRCDERRKLELSEAKNIEKKVAIPVTVAPALGRHPAGLRELKAFRASWYALAATTKIQAA